MSVGNLTAHIETFGCQMNQLDSELIAGVLCEAGFRMTEREEEADVILINTCAVRQHAEQRVLGRISALHDLHVRRPGLVLGVVGCLAQRLGAGLRARCPDVALVAGPDTYRRLPELIAEARRTGGAALLRLDETEQYEGVRPRRKCGPRAWVSIMRGCNNFCAYCVVPYVRGRERSRPHAGILTEVKELAEAGYREATLLGQNVNSYRDTDLSFGGLLRRVDRETGIGRVRFLTSHPKDLTEDILEAMAAGTTVCEHLHLPLQSGSSRVLEAMDRGYSAEQYVALVERARRLVDGLAVTTDVIAGFPGETEADFQATLDLMESVGFDGAHTYQYSPRAGTKAFRMVETVGPEEKHERLCRLIAVQRGISADKNARLVGTAQEVLVESTAKRDDRQFLARTRTDKPVIIGQGAGRLRIGHLVNAEIVGSTSATLLGEVRR